MKINIDGVYIPIMTFIPHLKEVLRNNGFVYTIRNYNNKHTTLCYVNSVGVCNKEFVKGIYRDSELGEYVGSSGFDNVEDWWAMVFKINNMSEDREFLALYKVSVKRVLAPRLF